MNISEWDISTTIIIFGVVWIATLLFAIGTHRNRSMSSKLFIFFSFSLVTLVAGLQVSNSDYTVYKNLYMYTYSSDYNLLQLEFVFRSANKLIYDTIGEFQYVVLFTSTVTNIFAYKNILYYSEKCDVKPAQVLFIYLSMYFLVSFGMMRQIAAVNIVLYSYRYITEKHSWKYYLLTLLAIGFHSTAIISLLMYVFFSVNVQSKILKYILRVGVVALTYFFVLNFNYFGEFVNIWANRSFVDRYYAPENIGIGNLVNRLPILLFLFLFKKKIYSGNAFIKVCVASILFECTLIFAYYWMPILGGRIQYYVLFGYAILIPYCFQHKKDINTLRKSLNSNFYVFIYGTWYMVYQLLTTKWITEYLMPIKFYNLFQ